MSNKQYKKPTVMFQSLSMSGHIASGCSQGQTFEEFACPVNVPEWGISFFGEDNCDYSTPDAYDMVCYHVPTAGGNVFTS